MRKIVLSARLTQLQRARVGRHRNAIVATFILGDDQGSMEINLAPAWQPHVAPHLFKRFTVTLSGPPETRGRVR